MLVRWFAVHSVMKRQFLLRPAVVQGVSLMRGLLIIHHGASPGFSTLLLLLLSLSFTQQSRPQTAAESSFAHGPDLRGVDFTKAYQEHEDVILTLATCRNEVGARIAAWTSYSRK